MKYIVGFVSGVSKYILTLVCVLLLLVLSVPLAVLWPQAVLGIQYYGAKVVEMQYKKKWEEAKNAAN